MSNAEKGSVRHAGLPLATPLPAAPPIILDDDEQSAPLLDVPSLDAPMRSDTVLAALEQLRAAYKVEHWACMEELRTLHSEFRQQGGQALVEERHTAAADAGPGPGSNSIAAEAPAEAPSADSFRQLLHALDLVQPRRGVQQQDNRQATKPPENADVMDVDEVQQPGSSAAEDHQQRGTAPQQQQQGQGQQQHQEQQQRHRYGDDVCGYGSDDEPPTFSDAEDAVLGVGEAGRAVEAWAKQQQEAAGSSGRGPVGTEQLEAWRERFRSNAGGIAALESVASASTALFMDAQGALACLCGRSGRYLVRRTAVSIGRSTDSKGDVDVDLAKEGPACKVSRLQAQLSLGLDCVFSLQNVGRRSMFVNGVQLERGASGPLPHLSLVEVGGIQLLFLVNPLAVQRAIVRSEQLVM